MPAAFTRFTVRGSGHFPYDMLRYDQCWPSKPEDVQWMKSKDERELMLTTVSAPPTEERWKSFGWTVTEVYQTRKGR